MSKPLTKEQAAVICAVAIKIPGTPQARAVENGRREEAFKTSQRPRDEKETAMDIFADLFRKEVFGE